MESLNESPLLTMYKTRGNYWNDWGKLRSGASQIFGYLPCLQDAVTVVGCLHLIKPPRQIRMASFCMINFGPHITFYLFIYLFILPFPYPLILKKWFLKPHFANNSPDFGFQIVLNLKEIFRPCRVLGMKIPFLVKFGRHFLSGKPLSNLLWFLGCFKISVNLFSWFLAIEFTKFIHSK